MRASRLAGNVGDSEVIQLGIVRISPAKSASLQQIRRSLLGRFPVPICETSHKRTSGQFRGIHIRSSTLSGAEWTRQDFILKTFNSVVEHCFRAWNYCEPTAPLD